MRTDPQVWLRTRIVQSESRRAGNNPRLYLRRWSDRQGRSSGFPIGRNRLIIKPRVGECVTERPVLVATQWIERHPPAKRGEPGVCPTHVDRKRAVNPEQPWISWAKRQRALVLLVSGSELRSAQPMNAGVAPLGST